MTAEAATYAQPTVADVERAARKHVDAAREDGYTLKLVRVDRFDDDDWWYVVIDHLPGGTRRVYEQIRHTMAIERRLRDEDGFENLHVVPNHPADD